MRHRLPFAIPLVLLALAACEEPAALGDGGVTPDASADGVQPPASPSWACPSGWTEAAAGCAPAGGDGACGPGEAGFVDRGCAPVGRPCPGGDGFSDDLPAATIHVSPTGTGDGSRGAPLGSIAAALAAASPGGTVALAPGEYDEAVSIPAGVTLRGACAAQTTLRAGASAPGSFGVVNASGVGGRVEDVRLVGDRPGVWLNGEAGAVELTIEGVIVEDAYGFGVALGVGAVLHGRDVVVRRTRPLSGSTMSRSYGVGVLVSDGSSVDLDGVVLEENHSVGALVLFGSDATLRRLAVRRTQADETGAFGRGVMVEGDSTARVEEALLDANHDCGATVSVNSTLALDQVVVRGTLPRGDGVLGCGVMARDGSSATLSRVAVLDNQYFGVAAAGAGVELSVEDAWIDGTRANDASTGLGLYAAEGAAVSLARARLQGNTGQALLARASAVTLSDVEIVDTQSDPVHEDAGRAIEAQSGATVTGTRLRLVNNRDASIVAFDAETSVELTDAFIADTMERACADSLCPGLGAGVGVLVAGGASLRLERFVIERSALAGAQLIGGDLAMRHGEVRDNPIGLNVVVPDFDLAQVQESVRYVDNQRNLVRESIGPPPDPSGFAW